MQPSTKAPLRKPALVSSWNESLRSLLSNPAEQAVAEGDQHSPGTATEAATLLVCAAEVPRHRCRCTHRVPVLCLWFSAADRGQ